MSRTGEIFSELQRRSVIRASVGHVVFFWVLAQVADVVLPYIGIVDNPVRWAVVAGVALFPITVVIAWVFEHPWKKFTRSRLAIDAIVVTIICVVSISWALRNLPQVVHMKTSIVILPFEHSGVPLELSLSRALAYEINSLLMKSRSVNVIGVESAASPALAGMDETAIVDRLDVEHALTGQLAVDGTLMRISLRLINRAGDELWQSVIERKVEDLFAVQEDIATSIQSRLGFRESAVTVADVAAARCPMPNNPAALEDYYTARYLVELRTDSDLSRQQLRDAIGLYTALTDSYPEFAEAKSGLAWALMHQGYYDPRNASPDRHERAQELATQALAICPTSGDAMHILPNEYDHENRWIGTHRQLTAFIDMQPDRTEYYQRLARHYREAGLQERASEVAETNYALNPLSPKAIKILAATYMAPDTIDRSIELYDLAAELGSTGPNFARMMKPIFDCNKALDCILQNLPPPIRRYEDQFRKIYSDPVDDEAGREAIDLALSMHRENPEFMTNNFNAAACWFNHLTPLFFELWEQNKEVGGFWFWPNVWGRECNNVWSAPEFEGFVEEVGLVDYWREVGWPAMCRPREGGVDCGQVEMH